MIDFHSHALPKMDDGSKSKDESVMMLRSAYTQGVEGIFLTPHFYPKKEDPESFLRRRAHSAAGLFQEKADELPEIPVYLGAEVAYFYGMSRYERVKDLSLGGSDYILIEMPFDRWTTEEVEEIVNFRVACGLTPVIAHFERYLAFGNKRFIKVFLREGIFIQSNAEFFIGKKTRRKALSYLKRGYISVLGSDCHNMEKRPENYMDAMHIIDNGKRNEILERLKTAEKDIMASAQPFSL